MPPACCSNLSSSTWQLRSEDPWTTCFSAPERLRKNVLYGIEEGLARHRVRLIKLYSLPLSNRHPEKARQQQPLSLVSPAPRRTLRCHPGQAHPTSIPGTDARFLAESNRVFARPSMKYPRSAFSSLDRIVRPSDPSLK